MEGGINSCSIAAVLTACLPLMSKAELRKIKTSTAWRSGTLDFQGRKQPSRCVTFCLGLLCALLLAGNIGQIIYYEIIIHPATADPMQESYNTKETQGKDHLQTDKILMTERDQLQSKYDALTAEEKKLKAGLSNLTKEKDQLQASYESLAKEREHLLTAKTALTTERDEFNASFNNLKNEKDLIQSSYNALKQHSDQLQTSYDAMQRDYDGLQIKHNNDSLNNLKNERDQLQSNYSSLKRDMDQLESNYNTLSFKENMLKTSYSSLWKDKTKLQTSYNTLQMEKVQLQTNYSSLVTSRDQLQKNLDKMTLKIRGMLCQKGWSKFDISCYFVSSLKKNWNESRQVCITMGADLAIVDSRSEQIFINGLLDPGTNAWIGLTDSHTEGTWMWVDGTPVTTMYWQPGQPNNFTNQDCGEIVQKSGQMGQWNDDGCFAQQIWIYESNPNCLWSGGEMSSPPPPLSRRRV
ncbi:hypothetical protein PAMP_023039 [Pampus punctatissimus]